MCVCVCVCVCVCDCVCVCVCVSVSVCLSVWEFYSCRIYVCLNKQTVLSMLFVTQTDCHYFVECLVVSDYSEQQSGWEVKSHSFSP